MKNFFFFVMVFVFSAAVTAMAQVQHFGLETPAVTEIPKDEQAIKALFARTEGLVAPRKTKESDELDERIRTAPRDGRVLPGDHPVFILKSTHEFVRPGETFTLSLIPMINTDRTYYIAGQYSKPNFATGEYDGTIQQVYFSADNGSNGEVRGVRTHNEVRLLSRKFSLDEDNIGRHTFNLSIYDKVDFRLVQQIIVDIYFINTGRWGRWNHIRRVIPMGYTWKVLGRFPTGLPIYYMAGIAGYGGLITGPDPQSAPMSTNGNTVIIDGLIYSRTTAMDLFMWSPVSRYAIVKPYALTSDVPIP